MFSAPGQPQSHCRNVEIGSLQEKAFDEADLNFLQQVAAQIALATDNALNYSQVDEARQHLADERIYLNEEIQSEYNFEEIIGESAPLQAVLDHVKTVAPTDSTVLVLGETGTGKELIARAIHGISSRRDRTFVKVNCAAIPLGLLESELFGHEKGAFTGAISQKLGRFELAHEGTLFLDEIGDIPLELQPKLLRVLQEQEFERLGSTRTIRVSVRLIAATSQDLPAMVESRTFRSDLYYRLNVFPITLPPLRERSGDIPLLVRYFVDKYARQMNKRIDTITAETMETLTQYHWPGNARELQNFIERAVILTRSRTLTPPLAELQRRIDVPSGRIGTLLEGEREHILRALTEANWVLGGPGGAAERLLVSSELRCSTKCAGWESHVREIVADRLGSWLGAGVSIGVSAQQLLSWDRRGGAKRRGGQFGAAAVTPSTRRLRIDVNRFTRRRRAASPEQG